MESLHQYEVEEYPSSEHAFYANGGKSKIVLYHKEKDIAMIFSSEYVMDRFVEGEEDNFRKMYIEDYKKILSGKETTCFGGAVRFRGKKKMIKISERDLEKLIEQGRELKKLDKLSIETSKILIKANVFKK